MLKLFVPLININSPLRNIYNNALNVIRDLSCCKQTVIGLLKAHFSLCVQGYGRGCNWLSAPGVYSKSNWLAV